MLRKQGMKRSMARFDIVGQLGSLRRYARSLTRDSADAEDLVHDALVRAYERRGTFRSGGNPRAWLLAILHNIFIDRMRSRRSEAARIEQAGRLAEQNMPASQDHSVRLSQVREAFLSLPEEQRAALHLVAIEGLSYAEAADVSGVPLGTLMSRIGRARAALREMEEGAPARGKNHLRIVGGES
ncbi:MAG: sigma-70 family RNA polymerase sigma factor [Mesorhizobium sp.]|uniref:sigma-70 family RNA polymerase sigma factor n=3 Tax=Mesorhizobium TaxID=68287 RepID=UPI000FC9A877|nr:sigma-70 family RNA polymerase sigma factor [Mesorhizobium sp.]RUW01416.1 sigma-70 family RNA polymerase sigma factor [Mesorhizobium sp. M1A.F.Ca.IN.020.04.1.1]RUW12013.1 sigma-70 family RNA polymerase sigma factor [Mesorhizobium sp. M1A.F.Ca.IN.020.03.1.1]RWF72896.1 MAG: sigma-70 family RNA polymerase sigma factor [Mesorhizobium sp.]RWG17130.1 MAG: sigma-70 family RNA polymerase sigma factor [Mesorhizobium sp.]RWG28085.1 MAG: sigma-70 family RNA polymerase sigma factor [Mesorhizobium sp.]